MIKLEINSFFLKECLILGLRLNVLIFFGQFEPEKFLPTRCSKLPVIVVLNKFMRT